MRGGDLWVLPLLFLLLGGTGFLRGQSVSSAVRFTTENFAGRTGSCSEFSFEWGNGLCFAGGAGRTLAFEPALYDRFDGMVWCLRSEPFELDGSVTSLSFDVGYYFFVEGCKEPTIVGDSRDRQGSMSFIVDLTDAETGERVQGTERLYGDYVDVLMGQGYEGSERREVTVNAHPSWSVSKRQVRLRVSIDLYPNHTVKGGENPYGVWKR